MPGRRCVCPGAGLRRCVPAELRGRAVPGPAVRCRWRCGRGAEPSGAALSSCSLSLSPSLARSLSRSLSPLPPSLSRSPSLSPTLPAPDVMAKKPRWQGTAFSWRWVSLWVYYNFVIKISRKKKTHNLLPPFLRGGKREGGNLSPDRQKRKRSKLTTRSCQNQDIRFQPRELLALGLCI